MLLLPERDVLKTHVITSLRRYWPRNEKLVLDLPICGLLNDSIRIPLVLSEVTLPEWARDCGKDGQIMVPIEACSQTEEQKDPWETVDWWFAAFLMLEAWHERVWEERHGSIHSYSVKLRQWDFRVWESSWVNRIGLFFRRWCSKVTGCSEDDLFGPLPRPEILVTHDVDAVRQTSAIRLKQSLFHCLNALRFLFRGELSRSMERLRKIIPFLSGNRSWWTFDDLLALESATNTRACYNFYADERPKSLQRWFFDPQYDLSDNQIKRLLLSLYGKGMMIGLHSSFDSWDSANLLEMQRHALESVLGRQVSICRQHWLRFSWADTWDAQEKAGIALDTTLMFNDRPGFRTAAALRWHPFDGTEARPRTLEALPTAFMDSHFYDYLPMTDDERRLAIKRWLDEIHTVGGQAALLWHPHTLSKDYGWRDGFLDVLTLLEKKTNDSPVHT